MSRILYLGPLQKYLILCVLLYLLLGYETPPHLQDFGYSHYGLRGRHHIHEESLQENENPKFIEHEGGIKGEVSVAILGIHFI